MPHLNLRFKPGLFGTQTWRVTPPVGGCPLVCTQVLWAKRAVVAVCVLGLTVGSVVVGSSSSPSMTERGAPAGAVSLAPVTDTTVDFPRRGESHDWTPTPQPGLSRQATERDRSLTLSQYRAIQAFPEELQVEFICIAYEESRWDETQVGDHGRSKGAWQVQERFWGPVPTDLQGQAEQAASIAREHGSKPWTTRGKCQ